MVENDDFFKMVKRMIQAAGKRAGDGDEHDLRLMADLAGVVNDNLKVAVYRQVGDGKSWSDIGFALGISRQAAHKRFK